MINGFINVFIVENNLKSFKKINYFITRKSIEISIEKVIEIILWKVIEVMDTKFN